MVLGSSQLGSSQLGTTTSTGGSGVTGTSATAIQALVDTIDVNDERLRDALNRETPIYTDPDTDLHNLLKAIGSDLDRLDDARKTIGKLRNVNEAIGRDLEKIGALVDVTRRDGETDDQLRQRIKIRGRAAVKSGTTNEMMELSALAMETDARNLNFTTDLQADPATFKVEVSDDFASDLTLSVDTIESELEYGVPVGHRVTIDVISESLTTFDATLDSGLT